MRGVRNDLVMKIGCPSAKLIGFTPEYFEYGTIYNALPKGVYINYISPIPGKEDVAIEHMLKTIEENRIRVLFIAPQSFIIKHLKAHKYVYYKDRAGCPCWTYLSEKGIAALCGRLNITPERLRLQSEGYAV